MKAIVFEKPFALKVKDVSGPAHPQEGEVKISIKNVGICGSDILGYQGKHAFFTYPRIPGHEFSGIILEIGKGVSRVKVGDEVCGEPLLVCGQCDPCLRGEYNVCENLRVRGVHVDGGFCEEIIIEERFTHSLPRKVSLEEGALIEPLCVALEAVRRTKLTAENSLTIFGAGPIGLCVLKSAKAYGVKTIIIVDVNEYRLSVAQKMGAAFQVNPSKEDIVQKVRETTGKEGTDVVIEASGSDKALDNSLKAAGFRARVGIVGFYKSPNLKIAPLEIVRKELDVVGSRLYWNRFPLALDLVSEGKVKLTDLITHRFSFAETEKAFQTGLNPDSGALKVVIGMD